MLTRKPRKGDRLRWPDWKPQRFAVVVRCEGNLCFIDEPGRPTEPFIWRFRDGTPEEQLNQLAEIVGEEKDGSGDNLKTPEPVSKAAAKLEVILARQF